MNRPKGIRINNRYYDFENDKSELVHQLHQSKEEYEQYLWQFVLDWLNNQPYIEVHTSGSTGAPKAIRIDKRKMLASARMTVDYFGLNHEKTSLLCMSTQHIGGMMMVVRAMVSACNLKVIKPSKNPLLALNETIDFTAMVPYQAANATLASEQKWNNVQTLIIGGGAVEASLEANLSKITTRVYQTFGMTETISHFALKRLSEEYYTCLPNITVRTDERDCLVVKAPMFFEDELITNDIVACKSNTYFRWLGRFDNAFESGGLKFIPEVLEKKLQHELSQRFFISYLPHPTLNNQVVLIVEGKGEVSKKMLERVFTKYEQPKQVLFINEFETTTSGKIQRAKTMRKANLWD